MRMKKFLAVALIIFFSAHLAGCETIQRKFTRKRKRKPVRPRFYQQGQDRARPNLELYMMHYTYWKTWQKDLVSDAGINNKRDRLAADEISSHLNDMKKYLKEDKAKKLDKYIKDVNNITFQIARGGSAVKMRLGFLKQRLDNLTARIARNFYYKKITDDIKPDKVGEGQ